MFTSQFFNVNIHKTVFNSFRVISTHLKFNSNKSKLARSFWSSYDLKLQNNITRAKSQVFNIVSYNKFYYFFTQTISSIYSRSDLKSCLIKFSQITRDLRKKFPNHKFYYCLIPEYHLDEHNWHLHGFLSEDYKLLSYINKNGFLSISCYDKIGWNSVSQIKHYDACIKYICKYITKSSAEHLNKGDRLYYASQGLIRENKVNCGYSSQIPPVHFDFKNEFCFKTTLTSARYKKMCEDLDTLKGITYYQYYGEEVI